MDVKTINEWADFWYYDIGVTPLPVFSKNKNDHTKPLAKVKWTKYQKSELDEKTFVQWKSQNLFKDGIAILGGFVYRGKNKGKYLIMVDCDNQKGIDELSPKGGLKIMCQRTLVEQHKDRVDKAHIYFYSDKPIHKKIVSGNESANNHPAIEIKGNGGHGIHIVSPSIHVDGHPYEITSIGREPAFVISLEDQIQKICNKFGIKYLDDESKFEYSQTQASKFMADDFRIGESEGRRPALLSVCGHWFWERQERLDDEETYNEVLELSYQWNKLHCTISLTESQIKKQCSDALKKAKYYVESGEMYPLLKNSKKKEITDTQLSNKDPAKIDITGNILMKNHSFITPRGTEKILLYTGMIYDNYEAEAIIKEETEELITHCSNNDTIETINKIKRRTFISLGDIDSDPNIITILNGILNIKEQKLSNHTPDNISKVLVPVRYTKPLHEIKEDTIFSDIEENLKDTTFYQYLTRSFTIHGIFRRKNFETILEIMASILIKKQIDQRAFIFLGGGENGKSVLLDYIESILGRGTGNVSHIPLHELSDDKFMSAELDGACVNIFSDLEENELKHTGKIKGIISGEGIKVQAKYGQPFDLFPFAKLLFSCNRFPKVYDQSQGFFRRWIIIKWERSFEGDPERVPDLLAKLTNNQEEKNLVFSCLIPLANRLNRLGMFSHTNTWRENQKEWNENADPIDAFDSDYIMDNEGHKTKRETYQFYKGIMLERGETPLGMGQFSKAFSEYHDEDRVEMYIGDKDGNDNKHNPTRRTERVWLNIDFKIPQQTNLS